MNRLVPLSIVTVALACFVLGGSAQATPAASGILNKLSAETHTASQFEKADWRRAWRRQCFRRCMWRTDEPGLCSSHCYRHSWGWDWGRHEKVLPYRYHRPFK